MRLLPVLSVLACVGALALAGVPAFQQKEQASISATTVRARLLALRDEVRQLRGDLQVEREASNSAQREQDDLEARHAELVAAHQALVEESKELKSFLQTFDGLEQRWSSEHASLRMELSRRQTELESNVDDLSAWQDRFQVEAAASGAVVPSQRQLLKDQVLGPVFQLSGGEAVGSAVLIHRDQSADDPHYLALSCFHVVRDILEGRDDFETYSEASFRAVFTDLDASERAYAVRMVEWDVASDLALLRIDTASDLGPLARLAPLDRASETGVFREIYTVGCPLGTAAQATRGLITRETWEVDGENYWMVSSPAYFGNSGGGVFHADTHELVGIFAKIYTHGSYRPQVITHMGLAVPLPKLHSWLTEIGYGDLLPETPAEQVRASNASGE